MFHKIKYPNRSNEDDCDCSSISIYSRLVIIIVVAVGINLYESTFFIVNQRSYKQNQLWLTYTLKIEK